MQAFQLASSGRQVLPDICLRTGELPGDFIKDFSTGTEPSTFVPAENMEWTSIYAPLLPSPLTLVEYVFDNYENSSYPLYQLRERMIKTEEDIQYLFENVLSIGKVKRVDFVIREGVQSAFIHFHYWYKTVTAEMMHETIDKMGSVKIKSFVNGLNHFHFKSAGKNAKFPFLNFKRNFKEIPELKEEDVPQNIHQIVHWNKTLVDENTALKARVQELEEMVAKLSSTATLDAEFDA